MKHIQKQEEPAELTTWKENDKMYLRGLPKWKRFGAAYKQPVHAALLEEQGGICCYCGIGVTLETSHVEHFRPRTFYPDMQFEYDNLLCSCQRKLQKEEPKHCGNTKGSWFVEGITVSPLDPDCEERFEYLGDGSVREVGGDQGAKESIQRLDLDGDKLRELRKAAITAAFTGVDMMDNNSLKQTFKAYSQRSPVTNCFQPFCMAIVQNLEELIDEM